MVLPADQLVRHRDADDLDDAGERAQVEGLELLDIADESHDRAMDATRDEGGAAGVLNRTYDSGELVRGRARRPPPDHGVSVPLGRDLEAFDGCVGASSRAQLDEVHRGEHEGGTENGA